MVAFSPSRGVVYATAPAQTLGAGLFVCEAGPGDAPKPRLLDRVRQAIEARHYSRRTEKAYVHWLKRYIFFHGKLYGTKLSDVAVQNTECWAVKAVDDGERPVRSERSGCAVASSRWGVR
jgi:hypothetical protein